MSVVRAVVFLTIVFLAFPLLCFGQVQVGGNPEAAEIVRRMISAAGNPQNSSTAENFTASGTVSFYWADPPVTGSITIRNRAVSDFRMDAELKDGVHSWFVDAKTAYKKGPDNNNSPLPYQNAVNLGNIMFPVWRIRAIVQDVATELTYKNIETRDGRYVYRFHIGRKETESSVGGKSFLFTDEDILVDALSFKIVCVEDHPFVATRSRGDEQGNTLRTTGSSNNGAGTGGSSPKPADREIEFSDYRLVDGVSVPFSISTKLLGERTMTIELSTVDFHAGQNAGQP